MRAPLTGLCGSPSMCPISCAATASKLALSLLTTDRGLLREWCLCFLLLPLFLSSPEAHFSSMSKCASPRFGKKACARAPPGPSKALLNPSSWSRYLKPKRRSLISDLLVSRNRTENGRDKNKDDNLSERRCILGHFLDPV